MRTKAALYEETGLIPTFDYSMTAIKSDKLMTESLRQDLLSAVKVLEDVPEAEKDWHPGSDNKVLDLVHPSLCPLVYGKTRVLQDRRVGVDNCIETCGLGDVIIPSSTTRAKNNTLSRRFQWLPSDVEIDDTGMTCIVCPQPHKLIAGLQFPGSFLCRWCCLLQCNVA